MPVYTVPKPVPLDTPKVGRSPWEARTRGFAQGALDSLTGLMGGDDPGNALMAPVAPMMAGEAELGPMASKAVNGLRDIASSAYDAVQGLSGKFYSRLTDAATRLPDVAHPNKIINALTSQAAPEEMDYRGLTDFLKGKGNQMVPRHDVLNHLEQNPIVLGEKTLGPSGIADDRFASGELPGDTKYGGYQLPGGTNYRERLTTVPPTRVASDDEMSDIIARSDPGFARDPYLYQSIHWDEPNIMLHTRTQERMLPLQQLPDGYGTQLMGDFSGNPPRHYVTGPHGQTIEPGADTPSEAIAQGLQQLGLKGRIIENIQSDWHQAGAREGYVLPGNSDKIAQLQKRYDEVRNHSDQLWHEGTRARQAGDYELADSLDQQILDVLKETNDPGGLADMLNNLHGGPNDVPDAPFKKSWPELGLKQELYSAAQDPDTSWIGITPGEELMKRGELRSPQFHDEVLLKKLQGLLKPFGGNVEQGSLGDRSAVWGTRSVAQHPFNAAKRPFSMAILTPEMKAAIVKRGFPIMSLLGLMGAQPNDDGK